MLNSDRRLKIRDHIRLAQQLAQQEAHDTYQDGRVARLALGLHLCRELADETFEDAVREAEERFAPHARVRGE